MSLQPSTKKLIGVILFIPALVLYVGLVVTIADFLPNHWAVYLVYYIITGLAWPFPLKPVMQWMNRPVEEPAKEE